MILAVVADTTPGTAASEGNLGPAVCGVPSGAVHALGAGAGPLTAVLAVAAITAAVLRPIQRPALLVLDLRSRHHRGHRLHGAHPVVSTAVGNVRNDGPHLVEPIDD